MLWSFAGITLNVEKYGDEPAQDITFLKNKAEVVVVGRKSSVSTKGRNIEPDRALFRCPVISRRHAKITFAQAGNVRILCRIPVFDAYLTHRYTLRTSTLIMALTFFT
jgi:hypothetical protein